MKWHAILSRLLDYPTAELLANLAEIDRRIGTLPRSHPGRSTISAMLDHMRQTPLLSLQADYVHTFDMNPNHTLHLTHHLLGEENRDRGPALINLGSHYRQRGMEPISQELPDFLPLVLEFAAQLPAEAADDFLAQARPAMVILVQNLKKAQSPYAALVQLATLPQHTTQRAA